MALKFKCEGCRQDMVVRAHKVGEYAACGSCHLFSMVPESAENIEEEAVLQTDGTSPASGKDFSSKYPALRMIASLYKFLAYVAVVVTVIGCVVSLMVALSGDSYGFLLIILSAFFGSIIIITFLALSEGIMIYIDMANDL